MWVCMGLRSNTFGGGSKACLHYTNTVNIYKPCGVSISTFHITMSLCVPSFPNSHVLQKIYTVLLSSPPFQRDYTNQSKILNWWNLFHFTAHCHFSCRVTGWTGWNRGNEPHFLHETPKLLMFVHRTYTLCRPPIISRFCSKLFPRSHLKWLFAFDEHIYMHFHYTHSHTLFAVAIKTLHIQRERMLIRKAKALRHTCKRGKKEEWKKERNKR